MIRYLGYEKKKSRLNYL